SSSCGRRGVRAPAQPSATARRAEMSIRRTTGEPSPRSGVARFLERFSMVATEWAGSSLAFGVALSIIVVWVVTGPLFGFSDPWQLVINTGTTVVTFLMVFLIQRAQNKESRVVQLKLSEIVAALQGAGNRLIRLEALSDRGGE